MKKCKGVNVHSAHKYTYHDIWQVNKKEVTKDENKKGVTRTLNQNDEFTASSIFHEGIAQYKKILHCLHNFS